MENLFLGADLSKKAAFEKFAAYKKERPYKYTKSFTEKEWNEHLYGMWKGMNVDIPILRDYIAITKKGVRTEVQASNYIDAKLSASKVLNVRFSEIETVL